MIQTSQLYKDILASQNHWFEVSLAIGDTGRLITENDFKILFGGTAILVGTGAGDGGYREEMLYSVKTKTSMFNADYPVVGSVVSGEIEVVMAYPAGEIPRQAMIRPYCRITDGTQTSEWIPQGAYFVDTRECTYNDGGIRKLTLHGYDALVKLDELYPSDSSHTYPLLDKTMVEFLADSIEVGVDSRTYSIMTDGYTFSLPVGYSGREVLSMIASAYAGAFIMTPNNELRLIQINEQPKETRILIDHVGNKLVFGGTGNEVRILV